jgi:DNA-binding transcriptional MocR family regulator
VDIAPEDIVITCGAMEAINLSLNAVARPGDIIAIESPTFYSTLLSIERMGMKVVEIATSPRDGIDLGSLQNALDTLDVTACIVMSNFQNPLGALMPNEKKRELVAMLQRTMFPLLKMMFVRNFISAKLNLDQPSLLIGRGSFFTAGPSPKVSHQAPASDG